MQKSLDTVTATPEQNRAVPLQTASPSFETLMSGLEDLGMSINELLAERDELLAAARDLLKMIEAAHRQLGMWTDKNPRIEKARAAIAKAEGR